MQKGKTRGKAQGIKKIPVRSLAHFKKSSVRILFTDIDDTLTTGGKLGHQAFRSVWQLSQAGLHVVPVTGRPAGWCEMIARFWPVSGVIGENGAFYFRYLNQQMKRVYSVPERERLAHRKKLDQVVAPRILSEIPGAALSSDQFCRLSDLSIDYCEDIARLSKEKVQKIVSIFREYGAQAKVSSIHVNGWFGEFDKLTMVKEFSKREFGYNDQELLSYGAFSGDSPNDEPLFAFFRNSFGVANVSEFLPQLEFKPRFIAQKPGGQGFSQIARQILKSRAL